MKRLWIVLVIAASAAACSRPGSRTALPGEATRTPAYVRVGTKEGNRLTIRKVPLEEYIRATILSEFAPAASSDAASTEQMFEVQAVVARTYALAHLGRHAAEGFDLCSSTHCQLYEPSRLTTSRWAVLSAEAVKHTAGRVLWFNGSIASALFHADCGGHTSRSDDVWGGSGQPYLASVADDGAAEHAHSSWKYEARQVDLVRALNADARTRVGTRFDGLEVLQRDAAGRAERIALHGSVDRIVRGEEFRDAVSSTFGAKAIRSTLFQVSRRGPVFFFEGRGFGHGVGLCQAGALARVRAGQKLAAILQTYFPHTKIVTLAGG
jgi:stage II sporulation protein D (peptidoglycan lytic transglycosylase)